MPVKEIYVNLPVENLERSKEFFTKLGFKFNKNFTDDKAACLIIGEDIYSMLITKKFFRGFISKEISDSRKTTEVLLALSVESRKKVDQMIDLGKKAGGRETREPQDHGWMYGRVLEDLDGHIWEIFWQDVSKSPQMQKK